VTNLDRCALGGERTPAPGVLNADALSTAIEEVCLMYADDLTALGTWTWLADGARVADMAVGDGRELVFEGEL